MKSAQLVGDADQKHRLFRVLQYIDNPVRLILEVNALAIRNQMDVAVIRHGITETFPHLFLQKAQHAPDLLERETFTTQFGNYGNFNYLVRQVNAPVPFLAGRNDITLVPPLQLAKAHARNARDITAGIAVLLRGNRQLFFCFEHLAMPPCFWRSLNFTRFGLDQNEVIPEKPRERAADPPGHQFLQAPLENASIRAHVNIEIQSLPEVFVPSNLTRKELLKQDKFTVEAEHTVNYLSTHRKEAVRYGGIALVLIVIVAAVFYYRSSQLSVREQILGEAISLSNAPVGQAPPGGGPSFPTQQAKDDGVNKAFTKLASDYSGTEEAYIAEYFLGAKALDAGKVDDARKRYQDVADHASANYASLAKLALAQLDFAENRTAESQTLLKDLMDHPTDLVSKTQATFTYAKVIAPTKPDEARKLFVQLAAEKSDVSQIAIEAMNDLPQK